MHHSNSGHLRVADRPADCKRLGIDPIAVAQFEDGQRIGTERGRYEWWYFDAHLDDGATVVVVFCTKPIVNPNSPLAPRVMINITLPDGRNFEKLLDAGPELFSASKSGCDVRIGMNRFVGNLERYQIRATIEEISVDIELTGDVRAWRPKSGHIYFGVEGQEKLFAWLPSVPSGQLAHGVVQPGVKRAAVLHSFLAMDHISKVICTLSELPRRRNKAQSDKDQRISLRTPSA